LIIIDEAQAIKNHTSKVAEALFKAKASFRLALSGFLLITILLSFLPLLTQYRTPVENKLAELWSIFNFVLPSFLGTLKEFSTNFSKSIEVERDPEKMEKLKIITSPFLLRRLKTDKQIIQDLPEKIIDNKYVNLSTEQGEVSLTK